MLAEDSIFERVGDGSWCTGSKCWIPFNTFAETITNCEKSTILAINGRGGSLPANFRAWNQQNDINSDFHLEDTGLLSTIMPINIKLKIIMV